MSGPPQTIGPYEVDAEIGRGGMGVVFRATDTRLGRAVAIKALPEHLADDAERLARFEREARTLAALSHPNVAGIFGVEEHEGRRYLILELVEGETLAERLDRGPLPLDEAMEVCAKIAAGVEAAHEAGVIHRDLKPGNVKITPEGRVKVLDFGLARIDDPAGSSSGMSESPTLTTPGPTPTTPGAILGTAPYMSPEQARGRRVDKRTDIWSFGVVLYECLTGESPFRGETATDSIGAILHKGVDLDRLPPDTPFLVRHLIERCLERDKGERLRDIGDARLELERAARGDGGVGAQAARTKRAPIPIIGAMCVVLGAVLGGAATWLAGPGPVESASRALRFELPLETPDGEPIVADQMAFSPDGSTLVIAPVGAGPLWVRDLDTFEVRPVAGSDDAWDPSFTPDGRSIVFQAPGGIFRVSIDGGMPVQLYSSAGVHNDLLCVTGGWLIGADREGRRLYRGHLDGRPFEQFATAVIDGEQLGFDDYTAVPGRPYLLVCTYFGNRIDALNTVAVSIEDGSSHLVMQNAASAAATVDGRLVFTRDADLYSAPLDLDRLEVTGEATLIVDGVATDTWGSTSVYAVAPTGELAYLPGARATRGRSIVRVERDGAWASIGPPDDYFENFFVSPDGSQAVVSTLRRAMETWLFDLERGSLRRLTADGEQYGFLWAPDGSQLLHQQVYPERGYAQMDVVVREARSGAQPRRLLTGENLDLVGWVSGGAEALVDRRVQSADGRSTWEFLTVPLDDPESASVLFTDDQNSFGKALSPDGRWMAYISEQSGGSELHIRDITAPTRSWQVSANGAWYAIRPLWSRDGTTLHWVHDEAMYAATIEFTDAGPRIGETVELFRTPWPQADSRWERWDIGPEGEFYALSPPDWQIDPEPVRVMTEW